MEAKPNASASVPRTFTDRCCKIYEFAAKLIAKTNFVRYHESYQRHGMQTFYLQIDKISQYFDEACRKTYW